MSDLILDLPTSPTEAQPVLQEAQDKNSTPYSISVSDIQDYISPKLYRELSWDENRTADEVTEDCIERAKIFLATLLHLVGVEVNEYSKTQSEIVKALTVYELYLYNGDRYKAKSFLDKAEKLIENRYKSLEVAKNLSYPTCSVAKRLK